MRRGELARLDSHGPRIGGFIYGPRETTIEQINDSPGAVAYPHHDRAGSTRLLTGSIGTVTGKCTYSAPSCEGTATTRSGSMGRS
jgi:hypothetical protein